MFKTTIEDKRLGTNLLKWRFWHVPNKSRASTTLAQPLPPPNLQCWTDTYSRYSWQRVEIFNAIEVLFQTSGLLFSIVDIKTLTVFGNLLKNGNQKFIFGALPTRQVKERPCYKTCKIVLKCSNESSSTWIIKQPWLVSVWWLVENIEWCLWPCKRIVCKDSCDQLCSVHKQNSF